MKSGLAIAVFAFLTLTPIASLAQAPAGSTGQCKDGTYTNAPSKSGACSGHKGVQTWYAAAAKPGAGSSTKSAAPAQAAPPVAATPSPVQATKPAAPTPAPVQATKPSAPAQTYKPAAAPASPGSQSSKAVAPGGGPGMVWVNISSKVYHCQGTQFYGTTKDGKYMSEADAKAMGARADHNKPCSK